MTLTCAVCNKPWHWPDDRIEAFRFLGFAAPDLCRRCRRALRREPARQREET